MKIKLMSLHVDDQEKALRFYTDKLGFVKKSDVTQGDYRWLTVASAEEPEGTELQLALNDDPAAKAYQRAMYEHGQPAAIVLHGRRESRLRANPGPRSRVHDAANPGHRLDHRHAGRHLREPDPAHPAGRLVQLVFCPSNDSATSDLVGDLPSGSCPDKGL